VDNEDTFIGVIPVGKWSDLKWEIHSFIHSFILFAQWVPHKTQVNVDRQVMRCFIFGTGCEMAHTSIKVKKTFCLK